MKILQKSPDRDFVILNITDTHVKLSSFTEGDVTGDVLRYTLSALISRTAPDLITFTGDMTKEDDPEVYRLLAEYINSFGIPWAPVFGNHDNENGAEVSEQIADIICAFDKCLFENGPGELGCGNYVIGVREKNIPVTALIMMDTHSFFRVNIDDKSRFSWGEISKEQDAWYRRQVARLKEDGYKESQLFIHIPLYTYGEVLDASYVCVPEESPETFYDFPSENVKIALPDTFGVAYEEASGPLRDNGFFDTLAEETHTNHVICGHNHINSASFIHRGIRLSYSLKLGCGSYNRCHLNGGTVLTVGSDGFKSVRHEYVDTPYELPLFAD